MLSVTYFFIGCNPSVLEGVINSEALIPIDATIKMGTLSNGMTYYIKKNAKPEQKLELRLVVNAGSILEDEKQLGLAHFMEHMNFNALNI